ncbi:MAG TPA: DUF4190 domain-containing protein [Leifsonia sp.]|jgi:uncharacterized protein YacL|nr:DUF4190 domain-containing protein [Leifsonia sp.]
MSTPDQPQQPDVPQQPQYGQPPAAPQYGESAPYAPAQRGYNTMAIVAFILAFFISIVGIILGFVALSQIKKTGEQGRGLAIAAIIIGFVEIAIGIIITIIVVAVLGTASTYQINS